MDSGRATAAADTRPWPPISRVCSIRILPVFWWWDSPGQTASRFLMHDIERLDCVEIEGELVDLVRQHFDSDWMQDPRVTLIVDDGRSYLSRTRQQYDLVSIEVGQMFRSGVTTFYTADFIAAPAGRCVQAVCYVSLFPTAFLDSDSFRVVLATFIDVFPESVLWYNTSEMLLIGSHSGAIQLHRDRVDQVQLNPEINRDLDFAYWGGTPLRLNRDDVFLAGFLVGPEGLRKVSRGVSVYRDDRPHLEYTTADFRLTGGPGSERIRRHFQRQLQIGQIIQEHLTSVSTILDQPDAPGVSAGLGGESELSIADLQRMNVAEITATMHADLGDYHLSRQQVNLAINWYEHALKLMPEHSNASAKMGMIQQSAGQFDEAIAHFRMALTTNPEFTTVHNRLGTLLGSLQQYDEAAAHFTRSLAWHLPASKLSMAWESHLPFRGTGCGRETFE